MKVNILLFHRVHPERDFLWDPMDPKLFENILKYVKKKYTIIPLREFFFMPKREYRKPPLIITFDDGYKDFIEYSLPLLQKYSMSSSMFIVTDSIGNSLPPWTYVIDYLFYNTAKLEIEDIDFKIYSEYEVNCWKNKDEQIKYCKKFKQYLKKIPHRERNKIINSLINNFNDVEVPKNLMLSWAEINQLKNEGVEIGSHTVTHPPLATIEDEKELEFELYNSAKCIEKKTGEFPISISYPVGSYNARVKLISQKVGYKLGLAVNQDIYDESKHDNFEIPRLELYNEFFSKTKLRISGTLTKIKKLIGR